MPALLLLAFLLAPAGGSPAFAQTETAPAVSTSPAKAPEQGPRILAQIRILGLKRLEENAVKAKLKAREMTPYPPEDEALDKAALLASGDFASVSFDEVALSSTAFRLDIDVVETTPVAQPTATPGEITDLSTAAVHISTRPVLPPGPHPTWTVKPTPHVVPPGQEGQPQPPWVIGDVAVQGNRHVKFNVVRSQVKARKGDLYEKTDLDHDVQSLLGMGSFDRVAADITPLHAPVPSHLAESSGSTTTVRVTFVVVEKPLVRKIKFAGNKKLSKGKLSDEVTIKEKDPLDRVKLRTDEDKVLEEYHKKGYLHAVVGSTVTVDTQTAMADVTFTVEEGPKTTVGSVEIEGLHAYSKKKVVGEMTNRPPTFWGAKVYAEKELAEDKKKIEALYKNDGYTHFTITSSSVEFSTDNTKAAIRLAFGEGQRYRFGDTTFSGYTVYPSSTLAKQIDYHRGRVFNQEKYETTIRSIQELYAEQGRLRA